MLGEAFCTNFLALARNELALYEANAAGDPDDVTAWEFTRYAAFT